MVKLEIEEYKDKFAHLNGTTYLEITKLDIARAFMTIGFPKISVAISRTGFGRFVELLFKAYNYLEKIGGYYQLKPIFKYLDASEQRSISYFYGQALTKLYAEIYLDCIFVDNVDNYKGIITYHNTATTFKPKSIKYATKKVSKVPDLIGVQENRKTHVLEAKFYSSGFNGGEFQHAINQVSRINKVDNDYPLTKSACFFDASGCPIVGHIVDPDNDDKSLNINYEFQTFLKNYYIYFKRGIITDSFLSLKIGNVSFAVFRIYGSLFYGVEINIFNAVNSGTEINPRINLAEIKKENQNYSIGPDGIIIGDLNMMEQSAFEF